MTADELAELKAECRYSDEGGFDEAGNDLSSVDALVDYKNALEDYVLRLAPSAPGELTWVVCVRHPDYENEYETFPGEEPGVAIVTIDTGAGFTNGTPSRYWCAERYFGLPDGCPTHVKRAVLATLKGLCEQEEKLKRGEDPGEW